VFVAGWTGSSLTEIRRQCEYDVDGGRYCL